MKTVEEALAALPDTATEIAAFLRARGISGKPMTSDCCPITRYLYAETGNRTICTADKYVSASGHGEMWDLPAAAMDFVYRFDGEQWPDLIEK